MKLAWTSNWTADIGSWHAYLYLTDTMHACSGDYGVLIVLVCIAAHFVVQMYVCLNHSVLPLIMFIHMYVCLGLSLVHTRCRECWCKSLRSCARGLASTRQALRCQLFSFQASLARCIVVIVVFFTHIIAKVQFMHCLQRIPLSIPVLHITIGHMTCVDTYTCYYSHIQGIVKSVSS